MNRIRVEILGMSSGYSQKGTYTLIMGEPGGEIKLPIVIGAFEAQSIALVIENIVPQRPLTHDLFKSVFEAAGIELLEVFIHQLIAGVFYSKIICLKDGKQFEIDARSSDAIALAIRFNSPIFVDSKIMDEAGILIDEKDDEEPERPEKEQPKVEKKDSLSHHDLHELEKMLEDAIQVEDYDKAALIRDEIARRRSN